MCQRCGFPESRRTACILTQMALCSAFAVDTVNDIASYMLRKIQISHCCQEGQREGQSRKHWQKPRGRKERRYEARLSLLWQRCHCPRSSPLPTDRSLLRYHLLREDSCAPTTSYLLPLPYLSSPDCLAMGHVNLFMFSVCLPTRM